MPAVSELSLEEAYAVQDRVAAMRVARGEVVVGYKVGCTSRAIRTQFGLDEPISGRLFRLYVYEAGAKINRDEYVNCAIEPEMVLAMGTDLRFFRRRGIPAYGFTPFLLEMELYDTVHGVDERLPVGSLEPAIRVVYDALGRM